MRRNYKHIDKYLDELEKDIYAQPQDSGHTELAIRAIHFWYPYLRDCKTVLDVGCGEGFCQDIFEVMDLEYTGICLGIDDIKIALENKRNVFEMDFSFLCFEDKSFDVIFSRHSLEHSPMPLLTLMEWYRVSRKFLAVVVPAPEHYTYKGLQHYSVMNEEQIENLFKRAGWNVMEKHLEYTDDPSPEHPWEYWYWLEKNAEQAI